MRLVSVKVEGYRSIAGPLELHLDPRATVLLGANDHGKSNLLSALLHLNATIPFAASDLNWDSDADTEDAKKLPRADFTFELSAAERAALHEVENAARVAANADAKAAPKSEIPTMVSVIREGVGAGLKYAPRMTEGVITTYLKAACPEVGLILPTESIPDSVTRAQLDEPSHEFFKGLFYYAGIEEDEWDTVFNQTGRSVKRLERASVQLNAALRAAWAQGSELTFSLLHNSAAASIELWIDDPAVSGTKARVSQRSSGFTHFFALKTILFAKQQEADANSYIWLFDEPGIYLHPAGQRDLLQALEAIAQTNQVLYATHSLFLINKNFHSRHRLVHKDSGGTRLDSKPFTSRWRSALDALGLSLPGTILFAQHVLLVEGATDALLVHAVLEKLAESDRIAFDLNSFAAMGMNDCRSGGVLASVLLEARPAPTLAVMVDGDAGGDDYLRFLADLTKRDGIQTLRLEDGFSMEDTLPLPQLYVQAALTYSSGLPGASGDVEAATSVVMTAYESERAEIAASGGLSRWTLSHAAKAFGLKDEPSKLGVAREYAALLRECPPLKVADAKPFARVVRHIERALSPGTRTAAAEILAT